MFQFAGSPEIYSRIKHAIKFVPCYKRMLFNRVNSNFEPKIDSRVIQVCHGDKNRQITSHVIKHCARELAVLLCLHMQYSEAGSL